MTNGNTDPATHQTHFTSAPLFAVTGRMSVFGGPHDTGMAPDEGLALLSPHDVGDAAFAALLLPHQPAGTTGLGRRLNPAAHYLACRWDYQRTPPSLLRHSQARITNLRTGTVLEGVRPVDWGPNTRTGRVADLAPGVAQALGLYTDDEVRVELFRL